MPLVGLILDKFGITVAFVINLVVQCIFVVLLCIHIVPLQILSFILFAFLNTSNGTLMFAFLPQMYVWSGVFLRWPSSRFGYTYYGRLLAIYSIVGACFSFLQNPLVSVTLSTFHGNFRYVNFLFLLLSIPLYGFPLLLFIRSRKAVRHNLVEIKNDTK